MHTGPVAVSSVKACSRPSSKRWKSAGCRSGTTRPSAPSTSAGTDTSWTGTRIVGVCCPRSVAAVRHKSRPAQDKALPLHDRRAVEVHLAADDRIDDVGGQNLVLRNRQDVLREHRNVGK